MSWSLYKVVFRLQSPLHIGWRKSANLQQTRPYVSGKNVWGALAFRLTQSSGNSDYQSMGEKVANQLRFSYFYPSTNTDEVDVWPWDKDKAKFDWLFMGSYVSTALNLNTAETGKLHETEYISPVTRDGQPVYLIGYIVEKDGTEIEWRRVLNHLQFGGERNAGWGRIEKVGEPIKTEKIFNYQFHGGDDAPKIIKQPQNKLLFAHTMADGENRRGVLEPVIGRDTTSSKGFGGVITPAELCWMPGSEPAETDLAFEILEKSGIWKRVSN